METERMFELVTALGRAKSAQNVTEAMKYQHPDMVLSTPAFGSTVTGHEANAVSLSRFFKWFPDYNVEIEGYAGDGKALTIWGRVQMTWTGDHLGVEPNGETADLPVFMQFRFNDELIASELFFIDLADLCAQSGVSTDVVRARLFDRQSATAA